jgi:ankyrin repeat protein
MILVTAQVEAPNGRTPLMEAVLRRDLPAVRAELASGADPNRADARGNTALLLAGSELPIVRLLLEAGADVNVANDEGVTALILAAQRSEETVRVLLDAGADVTPRDIGGVSALTVARRANNDGIVALLRRAGAEESLEERLHQAIRDGDRAEVARLVEAEANVDGLDTIQFQPPLMTALESQEIEILLDLLGSGADPTLEATGFETTGDNAIATAARLSSPWVLRRFLEARARDEDLEAVLFIACGDAAVLSVALDFGASDVIDSRDASGRTPLICAAATGSSEAVALLLEAGADASAVSSDGLTAYEAARRAGHESVASRLRDAMKN